jgi:hypothetical protein
LQLRGPLCIEHNEIRPPLFTRCPELLPEGVYWSDGVGGWRIGGAAKSTPGHVATLLTGHWAVWLKSQGLSVRIGDAIHAREGFRVEFNPKNSVLIGEGPTLLNALAAACHRVLDSREGQT